MIQRIVLKNFMAHEHSVIELGPGLSVLTGPNNTGKSAVVEALRCITQNPQPRHHIRHGSREARVEVHLDDGWRVVWIRRKAYPMYEVWAPDAEEPEIHAKIGRRVPEDVQRLLRMPLVELEEGGSGKDNEVDVHLGNQRYPIFLLDRSGSVFAQFFAASTESTHLLAMQDLLKDKTRDAKRTEKTSTERLRRLEGELMQLAALPDLELQSQQAENLLEGLRRLQQTIPAMERLLLDLHAVQRKRRRHTKERLLFETLRQPPAMQPVDRLARLLESITRTSRLKYFSRKRQHALQFLATPPALHETPRLARLLLRLQQTLATHQNLRQQQLRLRPLAAPQPLFPARQLARIVQTRKAFDASLNKARSLQQTLAPLAEPPGLQPTAPLVEYLHARRELVRTLHKTQKQRQTLVPLSDPPQARPLEELVRKLQQLRELQKRLDRLQLTQQHCQRLTAAPELYDLHPLRGIRDRLRQLHARRESLRREAAEREQALLAFREKLDARLQELGACPLCGAALETENFLEQGHVHG